MDSLVLSNIAHRPARTAVSILGTAVGVLLIVFTVGLSHGVLHERGRRESNIGAEIMVRASGTLGFGGSSPFMMPVARAATRKIGPVAYVGGRNNNYGFGALNASALDLDLIFANGFN